MNKEYVSQKKSEDIEFLNAYNNIMKTIGSDKLNKHKQELDDLVNCDLNTYEKLYLNE